MNEPKQLADPDDYLLELTRCVAEGRSPRASGTIRNNSDDVRSFRIWIEAVDGVTGAIVAASSAWVPGLKPGETAEFEQWIFDFRNLQNDQPPEELRCKATVFGRGS